MAAGRTSAVELTNHYLNRIQAIDEHGPHLNSVIEINPDALALAAAADALRRRGRVLGPLHGIPVLLKDNIDTGDRMQTTAGSFALAGRPPCATPRSRPSCARGGAVILGKTNLSEWANFRSFHSSSGWSGRGGQCNNPYAIDRNPCGSSSGSGAAVSANLCAVALGSETDGSIVCPASLSGVVGIKPTVGLTSRAGVVPISHTQDTDRTARADRRRCRGRADRDRQPDVRRPRRGDRRRAARLPRRRDPADASRPTTRSSSIATGCRARASAPRGRASTASIRTWRPLFDDALDAMASGRRGARRSRRRRLHVPAGRR